MSEFRFFSFTDYEFYNNRSLNFFHLPIKPFQPIKKTTTDEISHELNVPYTVFEILVAFCAIIGNLMVMVVFQRERKLRRRTNYYIVSLAFADFLVGSLGVPFAILASIGLPTNLHACLFTVSLLVVLCTISIFCLVAVSVDRYWAILYPMAYSRNVRTKTAIVIISMCWVAGTVIGFLPLFGWHAAVDDNQACLFVKVMDYNYLVFLYFATIITPAVLMLAFYAHIYRVIIKQVQQIVTMNPVGDNSRRPSIAQITNSNRSYHGGTMLRVLGAARKRDVKATQNLSVIVLFFMICWIPLYTINCIKAFCPSCLIHPKLTLFCIILSHLNSAVNPVLYAYHLKDFRLALKNLILTIMGVEVDQPLEAQHRYSLASQHRLQSMDVCMRNSMQTKIFIDSPIWLRQQQQQTLKDSQLLQKSDVVTPCLNNIHQTAVAVASVTTEIERQMLNIIETSKGVESGQINYVFQNQAGLTTPTPPPRQNRKSRIKNASCKNSYENSIYTPSTLNNDLEKNFLPSHHQGTVVNRNNLDQSLIACAIRDKICSDLDQHTSRDLQSNYEIPECNTRIFISNPLRDLNSRENQSPSQFASIVITDTDHTLSPDHKTKFRKSTKAEKTPTLSSTSCASNRSVSNTPQKNLKQATLTSNSRSISRSHPTPSNQNLYIVSDQLPHTYNNNYCTFHHLTSYYHRTQNHHEKFTPLREMSNLIFSPTVKHSSLFHLFYPTTLDTNKTPKNTAFQPRRANNHKSSTTPTLEEKNANESSVT